MFINNGMILTYILGKQNIRHKQKNDVIQGLSSVSRGFL